MSPGKRGRNRWRAGNENENGGGGEDSKNGDGTAAVSTATIGGGGGRRGALELMRFAIGQMYTQADWVGLLETADGHDAWHRTLVLECLLDMSHVGHSFLRHHNRHVRKAAERLTSGTAYLIGRMYTAFGSDHRLFRL